MTQYNILVPIRVGFLGVHLEETGMVKSLQSKIRRNYVRNLKFDTK